MLFFNYIVQLLSHVDESPAFLGGKANTWRKLTLDCNVTDHDHCTIIESNNTLCLSPS
jgi:hypothetical protein